MILLALRLLGGDLAVLQVVAWTGMILNRTAERGVAAAVQSTLDGKEPCPLCHAIKAARATEKERSAPFHQEELLSRLKLKELIRSEHLIALPVLFRNPDAPQLPIHRAGLLLTRSDDPPVPPPRCA